MSTERTTTRQGEHQLLKIAELAAPLNVSKRKAFALLGNPIPVVRLGRRCRRVRLADAIAFVESRMR